MEYAGAPQSAPSRARPLRQLLPYLLTAVVASLLYAFLPYHFFRFLLHIFLSGYYVLPLVLILAIRASLGQSVILRKGRAAIIPAVACIAVAMSDAYYGFFAVFFLLAGGV